MKASVDAWFWAFQQFKRSSIRNSVLLPCLIHTFFLVIFIWGSFELLAPYFTDWGLPELPQWLAWAENALETLLLILSYMLWFALILALLAFGLSTFTSISHIIAGPLLGGLASDVEALLRPVNHPQVSLSLSIQKGIGREVQRFNYWLRRALGLMLFTLVFMWIPLLNTLVSLLWSLLGFWMLGLQSLDAAADNNGLSFKQTEQVAQKNKINVLILGALTFITMIIPVVNLLSLAWSVIAGTKVWVEIAPKN